MTEAFFLLLLSLRADINGGDASGRWGDVRNIMLKYIKKYKYKSDVLFGEFVFSSSASRKGFIGINHQSKKVN